jgi:hypothetical protein
MSLQKFFLISFVLLVALLDGKVYAKHPTHMSVTHIEIDTNKNTLNYSIRLFQDDVNYLITSLYHDELFHSTDTFDFHENLDKFENYFTCNLQITVDGKLLEKGKTEVKPSEYEFWLYGSYSLKNTVEKLEIRNTILIDFHSDQTNLVIISYNKNEKGLTFNKNVTRQILTLAEI